VLPKTWHSLSRRILSSGYVAPPPSRANPSATHAVRSEVDERFVTGAGNARDGLVFGPLTDDLRGGHLPAGGCKPAFFAYFLCGGKESECRPAQGRPKWTNNKARKAQHHKAHQTKTPTRYRHPYRAHAMSKKNPYCVPPTQLSTRSPCAAIQASAAAVGLAPFSVANITLSISPGFH
jgi:hypothetical protein